MPNLATSRFPATATRVDGRGTLQLDAKKAPGEAALTLMKTHLSGRAFLVADSSTIADVLLYAYTPAAEEGGFSLSR